ncbi:MAG: hypothetical protein AB7S75_09420 [Desulfococcaceae bacterium]
MKTVMDISSDMTKVITPELALSIHHNRNSAIENESAGQGSADIFMPGFLQTPASIKRGFVPKKSENLTALPLSRGFLKLD